MLRQTENCCYLLILTSLWYLVSTLLCCCLWNQLRVSFQAHSNSHYDNSSLLLSSPSSLLVFFTYTPGSSRLKIHLFYTPYTRYKLLVPNSLDSGLYFRLSVFGHTLNILSWVTDWLIWNEIGDRIPKYKPIVGSTSWFYGSVSLYSALTSFKPMGRVDMWQSKLLLWRFPIYHASDRSLQLQTSWQM